MEITFEIIARNLTNIHCLRQSRNKELLWMSAACFSCLVCWATWPLAWWLSRTSTWGPPPISTFSTSPSQVFFSCSFLHYIFLHISIFTFLKFLHLYSSTLLSQTWAPWSWPCPPSSILCGGNIRGPLERWFQNWCHNYIFMNFIIYHYICEPLGRWFYIWTHVCFMLYNNFQNKNSPLCL